MVRIMAKAVKLADIAQKVGVSTVTVSKALGGQKGVSDRMREKIVKLADEMGYVQPVKDRKAISRKSYNIGLLIEESYLDKYDSFYWQMYQQVSASAMEWNSFVLMEVVERQAKKAAELPKLIREQKVDGIIILGRLAPKLLDLIGREAKMPVVYMDFIDEAQRADAVVSDNFYGAYQLTNYLFSMGHTKIAYVGTLLATSSITDRYLGYMKSLMEHGIKPREDWQIDDRDMASGYIDEVNLLKLPQEMPTAFVCNCDLTAGKLINKLEGSGYRVPEDISVVGYDNYIYPGICDVDITTYEVDLTQMAQRAVSVLLDKIGKESDCVRSTYIVEGKMVIKASVQKL